MLANTERINIHDLIKTVAQCEYDGWRFVTCTCADNADGTLDIYYTFDLNHMLRHYLIIVTRQDDIPSVSKIYFAAVFVENEMCEQFGIRISGRVIDYEGHFLLSEGAPDDPMSRSNITVVKKQDQ